MFSKEEDKAYARMVALHRGSYMGAHVLLNLLLSWGKEIKCEVCRAFYRFSQPVK